MNTKTAEQLKDIVKEKYGQVAEQTTSTGCCGSSCGCDNVNDAVMADDYSKLQGYVAAADLKLGCGLPTEFARMQAGDVVVDLGSGAGNDAFIARSIVGPGGKVIGIDMTEKMIERARTNASNLGFTNVEFRLGDIENLPLASNVADVVVSNCVLNLVPDKAKAFEETFRVLKPGGHFSVSDVVLKGNLPDRLQQDAELYVGCVSGAMDKDGYLRIVREAGFTNVQVQIEKKIPLPEATLSQYLKDHELKQYQENAFGVFSITVYAEKPEKNAACCGPSCCNN